MATTAVGALGAEETLMRLLEKLLTLVRELALVAVTTKEYDIPGVSPVTVQLVAGALEPLEEQVPPGDPVTV